MMLRNHLFSLRNVQMLSVPPLRLRFSDSQESRFQALKHSNMSSAVLVGGRSADFHYLCFQVGKHSDRDCAEVQGCLFADCQERHFQAEK